MGKSSSMFWYIEWEHRCTLKRCVFGTAEDGLDTQRSRSAMQTQPVYYWGNHKWHIYSWNPLTLRTTLTFHSENNSHDLTPLSKHPNSQIIVYNLNQQLFCGGLPSSCRWPGYKCCCSCTGWCLKEQKAKPKGCWCIICLEFCLSSISATISCFWYWFKSATCQLLVGRQCSMCSVIYVSRHLNCHRDKTSGSRGQLLVTLWKAPLVYRF